MKSPHRFLLLAGLANCLSGLALAAEAAPPNIVLIFSDEMRPDYLGCYGGPYATPNLDRLAAEGLRFEQAYTAASACTPSRYSVLTGQYPGRAAAMEALFAQDEPYSIAWNTVIEGDRLTIPKLLARAGYVSGLFGKNHVTEIEAEQSLGLPPLPAGPPSDPAVERWLQAHQAELVRLLTSRLGFQEAGAITYTNSEHIPHPALRHHNLPWISALASDFLGRHAGQTPFFAFLTPTAVHGPWHPVQYEKDLRFTPGGFRPDVPQYQIPAARMQARLEGLSSGQKHHTAGLAALDQQVGVVLDTLERLGCLDETLLIFTADHGVEPGKSGVYRFGNHVPLLMRWPERIPAGLVCRQLVAQVDLLVTLCGLAGLPLPPEQVWDGVDLSPLFSDPDTPVRDFIYTEMGHVRAVFDGRFQYAAFRYPARVVAELKGPGLERAPNHLGYPQVHAALAAAHFPGYFDPDQLYDLEKDPYQLENRWHDPELAGVRARLRQGLREHTSSFAHAFPEEADPFLVSEDYQRLVEAARREGPPEPAWESRDLDAISWPPVR
ncbi:MAG: sulfatase-like hydrolase/transferase [Verrucomicrobiota bacterium]